MTFVLGIAAAWIVLSCAFGVIVGAMIRYGQRPTLARRELADREAVKGLLALRDSRRASVDVDMWERERAFWGKR